jgi:hypothetical protein
MLCARGVSVDESRRAETLTLMSYARLDVDLVGETGLGLM